MALKWKKGVTIEKILLLSIALAIFGCLTILQSPTEHLNSNTVFKARLEEFRLSGKLNNSMIYNSTDTSENASLDEPFPIVMTPFSGSVDPFYNISSDGTNLWDYDPLVPEWMKAYFNWHKWRRETWDPNRWADDRWIIAQCLGDQDPRKCGGTADRLKPLPTLLRLAYENHRMFLIRWTRPAMLEEFLVPPKGGVDWRVPEWLAYNLADKTKGRKFLAKKVIERYGRTNLTLMRARYQSNTAGRDFYDAHRYSKDEPTFDEVFAPIWRLFFRPSPPVAQIIQDHMATNGLVPGHYVASHLRALYALEYRPVQIIRRWTKNAINCASRLRPGVPIFFTSDSSNATSIALHYAKENGGQVVVHKPNPNPPLHLDQFTDWKRRKPADYYDTFVDLYLIALAGCVAFNKGGYGHWGLLIGGNITCRISHAGNAKGVFENECAWHSGSSDVISTSKVPPSKSSEPLFLEPMS